MPIRVSASADNAMAGCATDLFGRIGPYCWSANRLWAEQPVLDLYMPDRGGIDILRHVRAGHCETRFVVLSAYPEK